MNPIPPIRAQLSRRPRAVLAFALSALALALFVLFGGAAKPPPEQNAAGVRIQVEAREARPHRRRIVVYGSTQPVRDVGLSVQTQGMVEAIPAKEGEYVGKGDVILKIDERDRPAKLAQAQALLAQREIEYRAAKKLSKGGYQTEIRLAESKAQLEEARARLKLMQQDLAFTELRAPFAGRLDAVNVELGDFVGIGTFGVEGAAARLIDEDPMLVVARLSEKDRPFVSIGLEASATLPDGQEIQGYISYLGHVADPQSRTFRVEMEVPNPDGAIPAGVSAELAIPAREVMAYGVSPSVLALDDAGRVGVKRLDADNRVVFEQVEIVEDSEAGMWIAGLPARIRLITFGQAYLSAGQTVPDEAIVESN